MVGTLQHRRIGLVAQLQKSRVGALQSQDLLERFPSASSSAGKVAKAGGSQKAEGAAVASPAKAGKAVKEEQTAPKSAAKTESDTEGGNAGRLKRRRQV